MIVTIRLDAGAWYAAMDELEAAVTQAMRDAAVAGAERIQQVARALLTAKGHRAHTKTPSAPGEPPARISGDLAASVLVEALPAILGAKVGPTSLASSKNGPYGRIQELGGGSVGPPMKWLEDGDWHQAYFRELPDRPYLKPATLGVIASGQLTRIYVERVQAAIVSVTG